jgi:hypothetical protein
VSSRGLSALAGTLSPRFIPTTPGRLRVARSCYDHIAGSVGVAVHDQILRLGWIKADRRDGAYGITPRGRDKLKGMGIDARDLEARRRRVAFGCLDWSERRFHLGGSLGAALLAAALKGKWLVRELDGRGLAITSLGRRELRRHLGLELP